MINTLEAESAVAGAILIDAACLPAVTAILTADDFALEANRAIFQAAVELNRAGEAVDPVTIRAAAKGEVSSEYIMQLMEVTTTAANAGVYATEARKASMRRSLRRLAANINERAALDEPRELIGDALRELERVEAQDTAQELATTGDALMGYYDHRRRVDEGGGGFVPTGFKRLDDLLGGGMLNSGLYVLAARPGMGKTTFALSIADSIAATGPVLFVSLEMDVNQLAAKRLGRMSGIPASRLMMGNLLEEERERAATFSVKMSQLPVYMNRKPWATVDDIGNMARKVKGLRCIVIDYFGLIRTPEKRMSRYEAMTEISGSLKALARSLKVPILCLAQLNRENMQRRGNRPQLSDLRDTGALEQDADGVIFLHRPDYYEEKDEDFDPWSPVALQIILEKNRHSGTGVCDAAFYMAVGRICPAERG